MLNSGAIALASLPGQDARSRCESLRQWLNQRSNCQVFLDELMLSSVRAAGGERNRAIASLLAQFGYLEAEELLSTPTITSAAYLEPLPIQLFWGCCWCKEQSCQNTAAQSMPHDHLRFVPASARFAVQVGLLQVRGKRCAYFCAETGSDRLLQSCFRSSR